MKVKVMTVGMASVVLLGATPSRGMIPWELEFYGENRDGTHWFQVVFQTTGSMPDLEEPGVFEADALLLFNAEGNFRIIPDPGRILVGDKGFGELEWDGSQLSEANVVWQDSETCFETLRIALPDQGILYTLSSGDYTLRDYWADSWTLRPAPEWSHLLRHPIPESGGWLSGLGVGAVAAAWSGLRRRGR